jgi:CheY-like chemotaxis protein
MRPRMLVVDDSPQMRRFLERFFGDAFEVESASDGSVALERLEAGSSYDVLVLDLAMPVLDGRELYDIMQQRFPDLVDRVVILTGGAVSSADERFLRSVPNTVVNKPFDNDDLRAIVLRTAGITT